jgi:hypothetical protein
MMRDLILSGQAFTKTGGCAPGAEREPMTEKEIKNLATEIAADLFTNGGGERADRLVLIAKDRRDLGGWGEKAVRENNG